MSAEIQKLYRYVEKKEKGMAKELAALLSEEMKKTISFTQVEGGRDGAMFEETVVCELFIGFQYSSVALYYVIDDSVNGYCETISVFVTPPARGDMERMAKVLEFLDKHDFTTKYRSFKERPMSYKHFQSYLDERPAWPRLFRFNHDAVKTSP